MEPKNLFALLRQNPYPGRGILLGRSADNQNAVVAYFIMGRSANSRNRVFVEDGDGIRTQAYDPSKLEDPSLIIYAPVRMFGQDLIVTNGDQTDTIYEMLVQGKTFEDALRTRTFEPDGPNYTPRISGIIQGGDYKLSIVKSAGGDPSGVRRFFYEYARPAPGTAHLIHTYQGDGQPLPSFMGEPETVALEGDLDTFAAQLWESLDSENKVSLFVRYISLMDGMVQSRILNKNI